MSGEESLAVDTLEAPTGLTGLSTIVKVLALQAFIYVHEACYFCSLSRPLSILGSSFHQDYQQDMFSYWWCQGDAIEPSKWFYLPSESKA